MTANKTVFALVLFPFVLLLGARTLRGQDEPQAPTETKPKPAGTFYPIPVVDPGAQRDENIAADNNLQPDFTPLTGVQNATLGLPEIRHSYWVPGIQWSGTIQSNPYNQTQNSGWLMNNYFIGNLSLLKAWSRSQFAVNYSGGGFFSTDRAQGNGVYQQLALSQTFQWNRWLVQILDQFFYSPETPFGFGGGTGLGTPGVGGQVGPVIPGMGNNYVPDQSIYPAFGPRYSDATSLQLTYATSPRGSVTASGSYGSLRFVDPGNVDNSTITGTIGYNYALTRENSIGAFYRFSSYHYPGQPQAFGDNSFNFAFSRKLTGRMALQFYGGPDITTFRVPVGGQSNKVGANLGVTLTSAFKDGGLTGGYLHGLTGGSGVFTGATAQVVHFSADHRLSRIWTGQFNFGYARNNAIVSSTAANFPTYNSWTIGGGVSRPLGRNAILAIAYNANVGTSSQTTCTGNSCSGHQTYNYITINFQWRTRLLVLP